MPFLLIVNFGFIGVFYWLMLIVGLLFHEYGHVYQAIKEGIGVKYVGVYVFGGAAFLEAKLIEPKKEAYISIAGPAASLVLAAITFPFFLITTNIFIVYFFIINIMFGLFNLIPAYPMDGGRLLNALLSWKFGYEKGVSISMVISYIISGVAFIISLIYGYIYLAMVSFVLVFMAYTSKRNMLKLIKEYHGK